MLRLYHTPNPPTEKPTLYYMLHLNILGGDLCVCARYFNFIRISVTIKKRRTRRRRKKWRWAQSWCRTLRTLHISLAIYSCLHARGALCWVARAPSSDEAVNSWNSPHKNSSAHIYILCTQNPPSERAKHLNAHKILYTIRSVSSVSSPKTYAKNMRMKKTWIFIMYKHSIYFAPAKGSS